MSMIFATFLIGALCGMGVGSGGLFVVYLTVILGYGQLFAQGLNLYFFIFSTASALVVHARGGKMPLKRLLYVCAFGIPLCIIGAKCAQAIGGDALRKIFAFLLIGVGAVSLFSKEKLQKTLYK